MKTRIDFVSNSSSCSFLIATKFDSNHTFDSFVKSIVEQSNETDNSFYDHDENKRYIVQNAECNELNLRYHLKNSELLFVGTLHIGNDEICEVVVPSDKVDYINDTFTSDTTRLAAFTKKMKKDVAKSIVRFSKSYNKAQNNYGMWYCIGSRIYRITKNTVWNTRVLLESGYDVDLKDDELFSNINLDDIEKLLDEGNELYCIQQNQGGDGSDSVSIYALNGWDSNSGFRQIDGIQILGSSVG